MRYDPFARGPYPVGVRSRLLVDAAREDRPLPLELWYPADDGHAGEDLAPDTRDAYELLPGLSGVSQDAVRDARPAAGRWPLVIFSHGFGGHRRQSTFLCTHLASHGYVVAACDHTGNTMQDVMQAAMAQRRGQPLPRAYGEIDTFIALRPMDVRAVIDAVLTGDLAGLIDPERIGVAGHSFGGWTTLAVAREDARVKAVLPLAPAGGESPLPVDRLRDALDFAWGREVPALFVVADRDSLLPLSGMHELLARTPSTRKRMVVLENTDHMHFCDRAEQVHELFRMMPPPGAFAKVARQVRPIAELAPPAHAYLAVRGLGLAHMDAVLKAHAAAAALLDGDIAAALAEHGVRVAAH